MSPLGWLGFVVAGGAGAVARHLLQSWRPVGAGAGFPWATLVVNVTGSFVLGLLTGLALYHGFPRGSLLVLGTGFCGAYTTFSTFAVDTVGLAEEGMTGGAVLNALGTLGAALAAAALGLAVAAAL